MASNVPMAPISQPDFLPASTNTLFAKKTIDTIIARYWSILSFQFGWAYYITYIQINQVSKKPLLEGFLGWFGLFEYLPQVEMFCSIASIAFFDYIDAVQRMLYFVVRQVAYSWMRGMPECRYVFDYRGGKTNVIDGLQYTFGPHYS